MKLTIKHIASYLPYGLTCQLMGRVKEETEYNDNPEPEIFKIDGANVGYVDVWSCKTMTDEWIYEEVFPILRNLSDLTKEIEVNGERFVPFDRLYEMTDYTEFLSEIEGDKYEMNSPLRWPYELVEILFEWKFDIYGLIENKLAIDINTL